MHGAPPPGFDPNLYQDSTGFQDYPPSGGDNYDPYGSHGDYVEPLPSHYDGGHVEPQFVAPYQQDGHHLDRTFDGAQSSLDGPHGFALPRAIADLARRLVANVLVLVENF